MGSDTDDGECAMDSDIYEERRRVLTGTGAAVDDAPGKRGRNEMKMPRTHDAQNKNSTVEPATASTCTTTMRRTAIPNARYVRAKNTTLDICGLSVVRIPHRVSAANNGRDFNCERILRQGGSTLKIVTTIGVLINGSARVWQGKRWHARRNMLRRIIGEPALQSSADNTAHKRNKGKFLRWHARTAPSTNAATGS